MQRGLALRRRIIVDVFLAVILLAVFIVVLRFDALAAEFDTAVTAQRFDAARGDHSTLRAFLRRMSKGGDLHTHLSGAVYGERFVAWAAEEELCVDPTNTLVAKALCDRPGTVPVSDAMGDQGLYDRLVNAFSMRAFLPTPAVPTGHNQFFATFDKFNAATAPLFAHMVVDKLAALEASGLAGCVAARRSVLEDNIAKIRTALACDAQNAQAGCKVTFRFIAQILRDTPLDDVFITTASAAALIRSEPLVVALNYVQPEDYLVARRDYTRHMEIIRFLAKDVPVALHAGELWLGLVPPEDLTFHIRQAVEIAGACRIGHGVALTFERDMQSLLAEMRKRSVAVEINLTSNDVILGVRGKDHPLPAYLAAGVPVVISTDDAGVSRIDMTNEYFRAGRDYGLDYRTLKAIARNALLHSFLDADNKREELQRFDRACADFERSVTGRRTPLQNLATLIEAAATSR